ncbi:hypothetical protein [Nocardia sp. BMG51109]|uniref:hypothetical protein n=1 Tax=Nocardia sp. BMG51109 TaxID=1056816 RepID=UPI000464025C|nr:hypothetical protein [Nocardia sp. BMG51109]
MLAATAVLALTGACRSDGGWHPDAQFAPSLRPAFGARVTDGQLRIWTGSPCRDVTRLALAFGPERAEWVLTAPTEHPATAEHLTLGQTGPGFAVATPLPAGFDWRTAQWVRISVYGPEAWGSYATIADVIDGSARHPDDTYLFQDVGWLDTAGVATGNGKTFLTTCTPDPARR